VRLRLFCLVRLDDKQFFSFETKSKNSVARASCGYDWLYLRDVANDVLFSCFESGRVVDGESCGSDVLNVVPGF